jgi:hypothetical protein
MLGSFGSWKLEVKVFMKKTREGTLQAKASETVKVRDIVQVKNPKSGHYVKIDRAAGRIISHKKSEGQYKGVPVARKRSR